MIGLVPLFLTVGPLVTVATCTQDGGLVCPRDPIQAIASCEGGRIGCCSAAAGYLIEGAGTSECGVVVDLEKAAKLLEFACLRGDGESCLAWAKERSTVGFPMTRPAAVVSKLAEESLRKRCSDDEAEACLLLVDELQRGGGGGLGDAQRIRDRTRRKLLDRCSAGQAEACETRAAWDLRDRREVDEAIRVLHATCLKGRVSACEAAARSDARGLTDRQRSALSALFEDGCRLRGPDSCGELARAAWLLGRTADVERWQAKACLAGNATACHELADVLGDKGLGPEMRQRGCENGIGHPSCKNGSVCIRMWPFTPRESIK